VTTTLMRVPARPWLPWLALGLTVGAAGLVDGQ